jgi:hypothetical protein
VGTGIPREKPQLAELGVDVLPPSPISRSRPFSAFSGDVSCDFEHPDWDEGFCNWRSSFVSADVFKWKVAPTSDLALRKKWRNGYLIFFGL